MLVLGSAASSGLGWAAWTRVVPKSRMVSGCRMQSLQTKAEVCGGDRSREAECAVELPVVFRSVGGWWLLPLCLSTPASFVLAAFPS